MMKHALWLIIFVSLCSFDTALSASNSSSSKKSAKTYSNIAEPSVPFPATLMKRLAGGATVGIKTTGRLNCPILLTKTWPYPNAHVTPFCYNAETSCAGLHLFTYSMQNAKGSDLNDMKAAYNNLKANVLMNLYACAGALQASLTRNTTALPPLGYFVHPSLSLQAPP